MKEKAEIPPKFVVLFDGGLWKVLRWYGRDGYYETLGSFRDSADAHKVVAMLKAAP